MPRTKAFIAAKLAAVQDTIKPPDKVIPARRAVELAQAAISTVPFTQPPIAVGVKILTILTGKPPTIDTVYRVVCSRISNRDSFNHLISTMCDKRILRKSGDNISIHSTVAHEIQKINARAKKK